MTKSLTQFDPFSIGFDRMFDLFNTSQNFYKSTFPPYNIKKIDENKYAIEMAVAGFGKSDIEVTLKDNKLIIAGSTKSNSEENKDDYIFKGIAERSFTRSFLVSDTVEIQNAELMNGILKIWLENLIPQEKLPKKIEIKEKQ